ncbi:MAG: peptidylprolyl isomerase [Oscillospiraceae bacterium]|nr:peptidylprolyl isomerase [Oscillospiraceae bacterium]
MKKIKISKVLRAGTALLLAGALCGCTVEFGKYKEPKLDKVMAHATSGENTEEMNITYEMFRKEYKYYLVNSGIDDDTDESVAEKCKKQRNQIINYLINEQLILRKAKELGIYELTEEEQAEVDKDFDEKIAEQVEYYKKQAESESAASGSTLTDEEKEDLGNKKLDEMLEKCGMTRDDLRWWAQSSKISAKLREEVGKKVEYSKAKEEMQKIIDNAEELYKTDMSQYNQGAYYELWLPEGSRLIKHILIGFDTETQTEIRSLRQEKKDDEADKKREEAAKKLESKQQEIEKKLDDGEKFDDLIKEYSADASGSAGYPDGYTVIPNGTTYMEEFQKAAFIPEKIGDRTTCVTDYGVHIMLYAGDAKISDEMIKEYTDFVFDQLQQLEFANCLNDMEDEYSFEIDYGSLRLDDPSEESSEAASEE